MHLLDFSLLKPAPGRLLATLGVALALLAGCSNGTNAALAPVTNCTSGMAVLVVGDSYLQRSCGCTEGAATINTGTALTCTVPAGTQIYIYYLQTYLTHQIVSVGSPSFPSSSVSIPDQNPPIYSFSFAIGPAGTYHFQDSYNSGMFGSFISI